MTTNFARFEPESLPDNPSQYEPVRIHDTVTRTSVTDDEFDEDTTSVERGSTAGLNPHYGTSHFGATAQNPDGSPVTALLPTTLVTLDGVEAPISFWVNQGRLSVKGRRILRSRGRSNIPTRLRCVVVV